MRGLGRISALAAAAVVAIGAAAAAVPGAAVAGDRERPSPARAWAAFTAAPRALGSTSYVPGQPPEICRGEFWSDQIGTNEGDIILAARRAERLWGRAGPDVLYGSATRAACLLGGRDADVLDLGGGGGAAWGEHGSDLLVGSSLDDIIDGGEGNDLLQGGHGADAMFGGDGIDGIDAGPGDDRIGTTDERPEIVNCGPGDDTVVADAADLLIACERGSIGGPGLPQLVPNPRAAQASDLVRVRFRTPEAAGPNAYRVVLLPRPGDPACPAEAPITVTSLPTAGNRVAAGRLVTVGLRPPAGGWCAGTVEAAVILHRPCSALRLCATPPPGQPIARLRFVAAP